MTIDHESEMSLLSFFQLFIHSSNPSCILSPHFPIQSPPVIPCLFPLSGSRLAPRPDRGTCYTQTQPQTQPVGRDRLAWLPRAMEILLVECVTDWLVYILHLHVAFARICIFV